MSTLRLLQKTTCCPDKWRYTVRETGRTLRNFAWDGLLYDIRKYVTDNGFAVPTEAEVEDQLCKLLPPGWCQYEDGTPPYFFVNARVTLDDIINGTKVLGTFLLEGMPLVSRETAEANGKICAGCYANIQIPGCAPCVGLANIVSDVAGSEPLAADPFLENKSCVYCKCASRANVWVPVEISQRGVSEETLTHMPEWCWKKLKIEELKHGQAKTESR